MSVPSSTGPAVARALVLLSVVTTVNACRSAGGLQVSASPASTRSMPAHHVIPLPASIDVSHGQFVTLGVASRIVVSPDDDDLRGVATQLAEALRPSTGFVWPVIASTAAGATPGTAPDITLVLDVAMTSRREAYRLEATTTGVRLSAATAEGLFRATQTLRQLLAAGHPRPVAAAGAVAVADRRDRRRAALRVARRHARRRAPLLQRRRGEALHRPARALQDQRPAPAPDRRPGLAHRDHAWPRLAIHGGSTGVGGDAAATTRRSSTATSSPTRPSGSSPSFPRSTCPGTPTRRSPRIPS